MSAEVIDLRTRAPFVPSEPEELDVPAPQPPDGLSVEGQQIWWDGWQARQVHEDRVVEAALARTSRFVQGERVKRGLPPVWSVS